MMKHEKALLVALAYIIGFTAAYIAFGIPELAHSPGNIEKTYTKVVTPDTAFAGTKAILTESETGLVIVRGDDEKVISMKRTDAVSAGPGVHANIVQFALSPDEQFVYFCEQREATDDMCYMYQYVVEEHNARAVQIDDAPQTTSVENKSFVWLPDGNASLNGYMSEDPQKPWFMKAVE